MKNSMVVVLFLMAGSMSMPTKAACTDDGYSSRLNQGQIRTALNNKRILAMGGGEEWNEDHCSNGNLFKVGVSDDDPVDPRAYRGTWGTSGSGQNAEVTYNYTVGGSSSYSWSLWEDGTGGLCWEGAGGNVVATAPAPGPLSGSCSPSASPASTRASTRSTSNRGK